MTDHDPITKPDFALVQIGMLRLVLAGQAGPGALDAPPLPALPFDLDDDGEGDR